MLTHSFYGAKQLSAMRLNPNGKPIKTLGELFHVLLFCWSKDTANPEHNEAWNRANPSVAQSDVTAILVFDMFGAKICKTEIEGHPHYFNELNGEYVDLTREQYEISKTPVSYIPNEKTDKSILLENKETEKRYQLLLKRISDYLK